MLITEVYQDRELELLNLIECGAPLWLPNPENIPQITAYLSDADELGYGGGAGGGKTDLIVGKSLNQHLKTMIMRDEGTQMTGIIDRYTELFKTRDGYNGQDKIWRLIKRGQQIEFGSIPNLGDEQKYQGRPHDLLAFDEATNIREYQVRFLQTWVRSTVQGQKSETLLAFNPPVDSEGRWVIDFFEAWLKKGVKPGDLRYYVTVEQKDIEVPNKPCVIIAGDLEFNFNPADYNVEDIMIPRSRTFIPARVGDNTYLGRAYLSVLQGLPEPLRSMMLKGDFMAGVSDSEWQVIPTEWVKAAQERWTKLAKKPPMDSIGVDVARGGQDNTILARRHGMWFDEFITRKGVETPDGPSVMALVVSNIRNEAPVHVDAVGVGSSPYDFLRIAKFQVIGLIGGEKTNEMTREGRMGFTSVKSLLWWRAREAFNPDNNTGIAIPPHPELLKDLTALTWRPDGNKIRVESRLETIKRIGRSPDWGSALVYALCSTPKRNLFLGTGQHANTGEYNPLDIVMGRR